MGRASLRGEIGAGEEQRDRAVFVLSLQGYGGGGGGGAVE